MNQLSEMQAERLALIDEAERLALAEAIHKARWPIDRQILASPFAKEDRNGREYCFRIADAVIALRSLRRDAAPAADYEHNRLYVYDATSQTFDPAPGQEDGVREALERLIARLESIHEHPKFQSVWAVNQLHAGPYDGPTYVAELNEAKRILASLPASGTDSK